VLENQGGRKDKRCKAEERAGSTQSVAAHEPTCSYVGGSAGQELWIFQNDGTPWGLWAAAPNATAASMSATVELTTCYRHTASCTDNHEGGSDGSEVSTHLELVQLGPGLGLIGGCSMQL
jgi:hypothetical protein